MDQGEKSSSGPLDGIRVLDWTMWQFGPVSTVMRLGRAPRDVAT